MIKTQEKDWSVESLRGLAIFLVVITHVIGDKSGEGMSVNGHSPYRYFLYSTQYLLMPLFTLVSGYVYALRPIGTTPAVKFIKDKAWRILVPMFFVSTLQFLIRAVMPGINRPLEWSSIWRIYFFPFDQFWYLQLLFLIFIAAAFMEKSGFLDTFKCWALCFAASIFLALDAEDFTRFFSFYNAVYFLPFFLLGIGFNRFPEKLQMRNVVAGASLIFGVTIILRQAAWFQNWGVPERTEFLRLAGRICGIGIFFLIRRPVNILIWLGTYSYTIYLYHVFFAAGGRLMLKWAGVWPKPVILIVCTAAGIFLPYLVEKILIRRALLRRLFLGMR